MIVFADYATVYLTVSEVQTLYGQDNSDMDIMRMLHWWVWAGWTDGYGAAVITGGLCMNVSV